MNGGRSTSLYIDTSVLLKLFFPEPESARAARIVHEETDILVSSLTRLEALVQIQAREVGGLITAAKARERRTRLALLLYHAPFRFEAYSLPPIEIAERQLSNSSIYCPTLDRLHLAAMESLKVRRLLTNDESQASAARALGFEVILPR